jgi:hypothetical protein
MAQKGLWESVYFSIVNSRPLTVTTWAYKPTERAYIDRILGAFLEVSGMKPLRTKLTYCIHELAANAKKANTKRIYFQEKGLRIMDESDYAEGMRRFKAETVEDIDRYLAKQREAGLYVKLQFCRLDDGVEVCVRNNVELTPWEKQRIEEKLDISRRFSCMTDAYPSSEDNAEGAGLGIVMMMIILKNLGFASDALSVGSADGETQAVLTLLKPAAAQGSAVVPA